MYNAYRARVFGDGATLRESVQESTKRQMVNYILDSPSLSYVSLNLNELIPTPCIVSNIRTYFERRFLFLPDSNINTGDYITTDEDLTYLATNRNYNKLQPELIGELCNEDFPISTTTQRVITGYNATNRPIYKDTVVEIKKPAVVSGKIYSQANNSPIPLADGTKIVKIPYSMNENEIPKINTIVKVDGLDYKITTITRDYVINNKGYLEIQIQRVPEVTK